MRKPAPLLLLLLVAVLTAGCYLPKPPGVQRPYYEEVLSAEPFTKLVVQVDHAPGRKPSDVALTHLLMTLRNVTSKSEVVLDVRESLPADAGPWSADALIELERATRRTPHQAPVALMHVLYPAGKYENGNAAGVTISGPVLGPVVVFLDALREIRLTTDAGVLPLPNPQPSVELLERATLLHEAGHAMGLVDNGLPMVKPREDPDHEGHTRNRASVMYWTLETTDGIREMLLRDGTVPDRFDADDRADLRSAGGR